MTKICKECKTEKELSEFNRDKYAKDGYTSKCKHCRTYRYELVCGVCEKTFKGSHKTQKFCSYECMGISNKGRNNPAWKDAKIEFKCDCCGKLSEKFLSDYERTKKHFCSKECFYSYSTGENAVNYKGGLVKFTCDFCNKEGEQKPSNYNRAKFHYCSPECMGKHRSIINTGESNPNYKYGSIAFNCDYCSIECETSKNQYDSSDKHFCSAKCSARYYAPFRSGEKAWNWNPNLTVEERLLNRDYKEYEHWRDSVLKRDNYTCQCCGKVGGDLEAHHKNGYDKFKEQRLDTNNGVTLCKDKCHKDFHKMYGYGNNTEEQFDEWIKLVRKSA